MVDSWRAKIASSTGVTRFMKVSSMLAEECLSEMSRTISPRCLS